MHVSFTLFISKYNTVSIAFCNKKISMVKLSSTKHDDYNVINSYSFNYAKQLITCIDILSLSNDLITQ